MTDRLFSLEQQVQRAKEEGLSAAQAYEDDPQDNRLLAIEQSLTEATGTQSADDLYTASFSESEYSQPFIDDSLTYTLVIEANNPATGAAIHRSLPLPGTPRVTDIIAGRVPVGEIIGVDTGSIVSKNGKRYVRCKYETTEGYINISHILLRQGGNMAELLNQMNQILANPLLRRWFRIHLEREFSSENLDVLEAIETFEELRANTTASIDDVFNQAWDYLVAPFLRDSSPRRINIGFTLNRSIQNAIEVFENPPAGILEQTRKSNFISALALTVNGIKNEVINLMIGDSFTRFPNFLKKEATKIWAERATQRAARIRENLTRAGIL